MFRGSLCLNASSWWATARMGYLTLDNLLLGFLEVLAE